MRQIGLIPSGCQLHNSTNIYATEKRIYYGSTVCVYVLNAATYAVEKILKVTERSLTAFCVSPHDENLLVTIGIDGRILLWNVNEVFAV